MDEDLLDYDENHREPTEKCLYHLGKLSLCYSEVHLSLLAKYPCCWKHLCPASARASFAEIL
jgi:hypothetical protein